MSLEASAEIARRQEAAKTKKVAPEFGTLSECANAKLIAFGHRYDVFSKDPGKQWKQVCRSYSKATAQSFYDRLKNNEPLLRLS